MKVRTAANIIMGASGAVLFMLSLLMFVSETATVSLKGFNPCEFGVVSIRSRAGALKRGVDFATRTSVPGGGGHDDGHGHHARTTTYFIWDWKKALGPVSGFGDSLVAPRLYLLLFLVTGAWGCALILFGYVMSKYLDQDDPRESGYDRQVAEAYGENPPVPWWETLNYSFLYILALSACIAEFLVLFSVGSVKKGLEHRIIPSFVGDSFSGVEDGNALAFTGLAILLTCGLTITCYDAKKWQEAHGYGLLRGRGGRGGGLFGRAMARRRGPGQARGQMMQQQRAQQQRKGYDDCSDDGSEYSDYSEDVERRGGGSARRSMAGRGGGRRSMRQEGGRSSRSGGPGGRSGSARGYNEYSDYSDDFSDSYDDSYRQPSAPPRSPRPSPRGGGGYGGGYRDDGYDSWGSDRSPLPDARDIKPRYEDDWSDEEDYGRRGGRKSSAGGGSRRSVGYRTGKNRHSFSRR